MTRSLISVAALFSAAIVSAAAASAADKTPAGKIPAGYTLVRTEREITEYVLDGNGLRVLLPPDRSAPAVTFMVTYRVGSRNESYGTTGATHLLEHLMRKEGEVCTRTELLSAVWGYTFDPRTNVVDVYIGYLRKKLERPRSPRLIRTVRGKGFVLGPS